MFRYGCTTIDFNWILIRQRWFSSLLNTTRKACLSLSLLIWMEPWFIFLQLFATWALPSTRISFQQHVSRTCQICYFELCRINSICHYLSQDALKTLISAFVLSRIDYCNSLLAGCPKQLIHKLKKKFRTMLQGSSVELLSLITYLPSFTLFTGFLMNKELTTNCFSLPLYLSITMVRHICLTSRSSPFLLDSCALPLTPVSFAFLHSVWNLLDNANSRIRPLFYGTLSRSHSIIPTLH